MIGRRNRPLACLALALALLLAQAGALLHASSHVGDLRDRSGIHAQLCTQCLSYSSVFAAATGPGQPFPLSVVGAALPVIAAALSVADRAAPSAFRSRAPPRPY